MKIVKKAKDVLIVTINEGDQLSQDIYIVSGDDDKNLITCTVVEGNEDFVEGDVVVTGKYSLYKLVFKGNDYNVMQAEDVLFTVVEE